MVQVRGRRGHKGNRRTGSPADDSQQPSPFVVDLTDSYAFGHAVRHDGTTPSGAAAGRRLITR